jgi:hypothetical protein
VAGVTTPPTPPPPPLLIIVAIAAITTLALIDAFSPTYNPDPLKSYPVLIVMLVLGAKIPGLFRDR